MLPKRQLIYTVFGIMIITGYNYSIDWPAALETPLQQQPYYLQSAQFNMIYFTSNLPIALLCFPIGMLLDRIGIVLGLMTILIICFLSQLGISLLFVTNFQKFFTLLLVFRAIFGLTGEAAYTVQALVIQRVGGKYYDVMMGLCLTIPLLIRSFQPLITTNVYNFTNKMWLPLIICTFSVLLSLIFSIGLIIFMKNEKKQQPANNPQIQKKVQFSRETLKKFNYSFWLIILIIFICEGMSQGLVINSVDLIVKRFNIEYVNAGRIMIIPFGFTPFGAYFWGKYIANNPHHRRNCFIIINSMFVTSHFMMYILNNTMGPSVTHYVVLALSLFLFSMSFAGFQTLIIPSITLIIPSNLIGTGFGIEGSFISVIQTLMPIFNTLVISEPGQLADNYRKLSLMYMGFGIGGAIISLLMRLFSTPQLQKLDKKLAQVQNNIEQIQIQSQIQSAKSIKIQPNNAVEPIKNN